MMRTPHWLSRLMAAVWAGHIPVLTWLAPDSLSARATAHAGSIAGFFMLLLAVSAALALVDSAVNDLLPKRFVLRLRDHRHVGFMAMALSLFMLAGIVATRTGPSPLLLAYLLPGFFAAIVVWPDMFSRHQRALA